MASSGEEAIAIIRRPAPPAPPPCVCGEGYLTLAHLTVPHLTLPHPQGQEHQPRPQRRDDGKHVGRSLWAGSLHTSSCEQVMMEGMSGYDLLLQIREIRKTLAVVLISASRTF